MLAFPHDGMMLFKMHLCFARGKANMHSFPPWWNDVVRDVLVLVQEGKLAHALAFPHGGMMLFEMCLCLCKRES
jgi:hypothetical protein